MKAEARDESMGARIKKLRKERGLSVEFVSEQLNISPSTLYRYESAEIAKLPVNIFDALCKIYDVRPEVLKEGTSLEQKDSEVPVLPDQFTSPEDAMQWLLKMPMLASYGEYDPQSMSQETIINFANEILGQLKLVSYKYRNQ